MSRRTEKIASQLKDEVARMLRENVSDPRVGLVTVTRIDVAPDLSNAIIHYSVIDTESDDVEALARVDAGLESAAPYLRRRGSQALNLKRMPELRFRYDPSLSLGARMLSLLREIEADGPLQGEPADAARHSDETSETSGPAGDGTDERESGRDGEET